MGTPPEHAADTHRPDLDDHTTTAGERPAHLGGFAGHGDWVDWISDAPTVGGGDGGYAEWLDTPSSEDRDAPVGAAEPARRAKLRWWPVLVAVAALLTVVGAGAWLRRTDTLAPAAAVTQSSARQPVAPVAAPPPSATSPTERDGWCAVVSGPDRVRGNDSGDPSAVPGVIVALEYAYYVQRSAPRVRALLAVDGRFGSDAEIQAGIDAVPSGTRHCVEITPAGGQRWSVLVTERHPDGRTVVHAQTITTAVLETRAVIAAIETA